MGDFDLKTGLEDDNKLGWTLSGLKHRFLNVFRHISKCDENRKGDQKSVKFSEIKSELASFMPVLQ
jgi:hypothetical protein